MKQVLKYILPNSLISKIRRAGQNRVKKKALRPFLGDKVFCPVCGYSFKNFAVHGIEKRDNARCHNCGSLERHRLLYLYLKSELKILKKQKRNLKVLHFAPYRVFYELFDTLNTIQYFPCDLDPARYNFRGKSQVLKADITKIPFGDNNFDFLMCNHVLEHVAEDSKAMKELYRVMKPGGNGIFQVPVDYSRENTYEDWSITDADERQKAFGQRDHVRMYGKDYVKRLRNVGFRVDEIDYCNRFNQSEIEKYGLLQTEKIYHCSKSID